MVTPFKTSILKYPICIVQHILKKARKFISLFVLSSLIVFMFKLLFTHSINNKVWNNSLNNSDLEPIRMKVILVKPVQNEVVQEEYRRLKALGKYKAQNNNTDLKVGLVFPESPNMQEAWIKTVNDSKYILYPYPYMSPQLDIPNRIPMNRGKEAMVYLSFIIEHYDHLPDIVYFFHHQEKPWHQDLSTTDILSKMKWNELPYEYITIRR